MPNLNKKPTKLHTIPTKNKISSISNLETTNAVRTTGLNQEPISVFDDQKVHTQVHISEPSDKPISSSPAKLTSLDPLTASSPIAHPSTIKPSPSEIRPITILFFKFIYV
jgi:hypothetical protein